jgi:hypothetical protein
VIEIDFSTFEAKELIQKTFLYKLRANKALSALNSSFIAKYA